MKKLGIITYYWPPAGGPGVQRWLKLSKYLARQGVDLYIVTVDADKATYPLVDKGLLDDVHENIHVTRTATSEKFGAYKKATGTTQVPFSGFSGEEVNVSFVQKIARFIRGNFFVPDARKGWNIHAYNAAVKLIKEHDIQHWVTTSPPHSSQIIGRRLQKNLGIHWTADFRDPWTDIYYYRKFYPLAITRWFEQKLERSVFSACDALISVSPSWSTLYISKGATPADKVHTITNGFDVDDFSSISPDRPELFTMTYAGTLASQYPVADFVKALNVLDFPVKLNIIGSWDASSRLKLEDASTHVDLEFISYVPKKDLNAYLVNSHLMLFLLPEVDSASGHVPGKLFDYLGGGNPILGLGPVDGDAANIIRDAQAGQVFSYDDTDGIVNFISKMHDTGAPKTPSNKIAPYERNQQAKQVLAAIFGSD